MTGAAIRRDGGQAAAHGGDEFRGAFDAAHLVAQAQHFYPEEPITLGNAALLYRQRAVLRRLSPNPLLDEMWYRDANGDVRAAIAAGRVWSGFHHFVGWGWREGRLPNPAMRARLRDEPLPEVPRDRFDAAGYLAADADARRFVGAFPFVDACDYFHRFGRHLRAQPAATRSVRDLLESEFDAGFYTARYLADATDAVRREPFAHYLFMGRRLGHSPNPRFDEEWYLAFYPDVRRAVERGELLCGFHHFLAAGIGERRMPRYALEGALESIQPGITRPDLIGRTREIAERLRPIRTEVRADAPRTLWLFVPRLNPDIAFGGYRAFFELVAALAPYAVARGMRLAVVTTEERTANRDYFAWRTRDEPYAAAFREIDVRARSDIDRLTIGRRDRFLAYTSWDALLAAPLAQATDERRVVTLVQEFEPLFHDHSSLHALSRAGLEVPSYPIFNTAVLRDYFAAHRVGIFGRRDRPPPQPSRDYAVFEHVINLLPLQDAAALAVRRERTLVLYARPERHAARNLYEVAGLALANLCHTGHFDRRWRFVGIGCMGRCPPVDLGGGHRLELVQKMPEADYRRFVAEIDIGISLMYAPHPSLIPFELATTGALVVTNTFENRPPGFFARISRNILACPPGIDGVAAAIAAAIPRVEDRPARIARAYRPPRRAWADVFGPGFLDTVFGPLLA